MQQAIALNIDRALSIYGWMSTQELLWLTHTCSQHERIVELGSYPGRSTRALADHTKGTVIAIDDFLGPRDMSRRVRRQASKERHGNLLTQFTANMEGVLDKIRVVQYDLETINPADYNPPFDMIFIDGAHDYVSVSRDIKKWKSFITPGGLISGHDFSEGYPGVERAVLESFG